MASPARCHLQAPTRTSIVPKAALEEVQSLSTNGASHNGGGLDFDELTDLIKCVQPCLLILLDLARSHAAVHVGIAHQLSLPGPAQATFAPDAALNAVPFPPALQNGA